MTKPKRGTKRLTRRTAPESVPRQSRDVVGTHDHGSRGAAPLSRSRSTPSNIILCSDCGEQLQRCGCDPTPAVDGATWLFDQPTEVSARWGSGSEVLWAVGQAIVLAGRQGTGKTTISGQLVRALLGLQNSVLGYPVRPAERVLYLAMDRPRQIAAALSRSFKEADREVAERRLVIREGPPWKDLAKHPEELRNLALKHGADVVVVDSLKDAAIGLTEDTVGAGWNRARQMAISVGIDVLELHHLVKTRSTRNRPQALDEIYGSTWITSGAGSVILLDGSPGDRVITLRHLKPIMDSVEPLTIEHDHEEGTSCVIKGASPLALLQASPNGLTAPELAKVLHGTEKPDKKATETARRRLDQLVKQGIARFDLEALDGQGGRPSKRYRADTGRTTIADPGVDPRKLHGDHVSDKSPGQSTTPSTTSTTHTPTTTSHPPERGGGRRKVKRRSRSKGTQTSGI